MPDTTTIPAQSPYVDLTDSELAQRISGQDHGAFEAIMRRHNRRLFRVARSITRDDHDAEDALQDAYLDAYRHMSSFRGGSQLATWLTRIVINHALGKLRKHRRERNVVPFTTTTGREAADMNTDIADQTAEPPPAAAWRAEIRRLIEGRIDQLPLAFRTVFILREVEELSVEETAACLDIPPATVRSRLFRARALLRESLAHDLDAASGDVFGFAGSRCDRIVAAVLVRLRTGAVASRVGNAADDANIQSS